MAVRRRKLISINPSPKILATGTMMLAVKMITAIPGMPLLIKLATPEKMVSSSRIPLENKIEIGYTLAGNKKILAVIKHAHVFCSLRMTRR